LKTCFHTLTLCSLVVALVGCATPEIDSTPKPVIRSISLVSASNPETVYFENNSVLSGLNPIFASAQRSQNKAGEATLTEAIGLGNEKLGDRFTEGVAASLRAAGYQVVVLKDVVRPKGKPDSLDVRTIPITTDAILQLSITYAGVYSGVTSKKFTPNLATYAVLYQQGKRQPYFDGQVEFAASLPDGKDWAIKADPSFEFDSASAVFANAANLKSFFVTGTDASAKRMSEHIVRKIQ
jgi:hypothetical protein